VVGLYGKRTEVKRTTTLKRIKHHHKVMRSFHFYRAMLCKRGRRGLCRHAVSVRLSVRLTRSWITSKRINIS